jgi:hypothetical protein
MRIDGTYRPQTPALTGAGEAFEAGRQVMPGQAGLDKAADAPAVGADSLAAYVAKAKSSPEVNTDAVAEARRLMEAGLLDTPEAVLKAAQAIVDNGI